MTYRTAPCEGWLPDDPCCDCPVESDDPAWINAGIWASEILWLLTGRQFGLCETTIRPCGERCAGGQSTTLNGWSGNHFLPSSGGTVGIWTPSLINGGWVNCVTGCPGSDCCDKCVLDLPWGPGCDVTEITIDGVPLLDVEYRIDAYNQLVRVPWQPVLFDGDDVVNTSGGQSYEFPAEQGGMWDTRVIGWADNFPEWPARSDGAGDLVQLIWPPGFVGRGQQVTFWVPPLQTLTIDTPERGTTIGQTPIEFGNGSHDDAAGTYNGGSEGMEYTIRFDGDQSISFTSSSAGFEVRQIGYLSQGGNACWPTCQDLGKPLGDDGTFGVTYRWGVPVPASGRVAAGILACELLKACRDDDTCRLPRRVTEVTRQGLTMTLIDTAQDVFKDAKTGIYEVDLFIAAVNPYKLMERSTIWSPEVARRKRRNVTTWQP